MKSVLSTGEETGHRETIPNPLFPPTASCLSSAGGGHRGSWKVNKKEVVTNTYPLSSPRNYLSLNYFEDKNMQITTWCAKLFPRSRSSSEESSPVILHS